MSLNQLSQELVGDLLVTGRAGLLVDFPTSSIARPTQAQTESLDGRARIYKYDSFSIRNHQTQRIGSKTMTTLVVLEEKVSMLEPDGFTWKEVIRFRVLRLQMDSETGELVYTQQLKDEDDNNIGGLIIPKKDGQVWNEIPFIFLGSANNDAEIDNSPLYDLAKLNIAHYKNSADYEESAHMVGQATLFFTSSHSRYTQAKQLPKIRWGSRLGHYLGSEGKAWLVQPEANQMIEVAMKHKEQQAIMLGARLITPSGGVETAEAARMRHGSEVSVLTTIVHNITMGMNTAIGYCGEFMKVETSSVIYILNDVFFHDKADPNEVMAQIQLQTVGAIAMTDLRTYLKKNGLLGQDRSDEKIEDDISTQAPLLIAPENDAAQQAENAQDTKE